MARVYFSSPASIGYAKMLPGTQIALVIILVFGGKSAVHPRICQWLPSWSGSCGLERAKASWDTTWLETPVFKAKFQLLSLAVYSM